jgi:rhamnosyltransferase
LFHCSTISVIIPVKNGASTLHRCLSSIRSQRTSIEIEIIVIDSESTDSSLSIARDFDAIIYFVKSDEFNHGLTRNFGARMAKGELLFYTVQDAFFSDYDVLEKMAYHFSDLNLHAVVGHQAVPHEYDKNPLLWYRRFTDPHTDTFMLGGYEKDFHAISWDNVIAMYRKTSLLNHPFKNVYTCEDWIWATEVYFKGYKLVYDPSLVIYHYHHRTFLYTLKTEYGVNYILNNNINLNPKWPGWLFKNIKAVYHLTLNKSLKISEKFYWVSYNLICNTAHCLAFLLFFVSKLFNSRLNDYIFNRFCKVVPQGKQNTSWN